MDDFDSIRDIPTEVLEAELQRRKDDDPPEKLPNIDWDGVILYAETVIDDLSDGDALPKDFEIHLMEEVMEAMYGKGIWKWWNVRQ